MMEELSAALTRLDEDGELWVGVIVYAGKHATAGLDLPKFAGSMREGSSKYTDEGVDPFNMKRRCTKPVVTKADFAGIKVRTAAPSWARWAENVGATSVTISANEAYDALSQGVVDCLFFAPTELVNFQLTDVVTDMTTGVPGGVFPGVCDANTNLDTWRGMSVEERAGLIDTAAHLVAEGTFAYVKASGDAMDVAREKGIAIHEAAQDFLDASAAFVEGDQATIVDEFVTKYGLDDAGEKAAIIGDLITKWKGLTTGIDSPEALQKVYWDEIYSKLDPETYALQ